MNKQFIHMDELLEKYWSGESSLAEEKEIRDYFLSEDVKEEHKVYASLFTFFEEEAKKSYAGEIKMGQSSRSRRLFPIVRMAASIILLLGAGWFMYNQYVDKNTEPADKWAQFEVEDPEEAKVLAMDALAFLSVKLNKGEDSMKKNLKALNKMPIK